MQMVVARTRKPEPSSARINAHGGHIQHTPSAGTVARAQMSLQGVCVIAGPDVSGTITFRQKVFCTAPPRRTPSLHACNQILEQAPRVPIVCVLCELTMSGGTCLGLRVVLRVV